MIYFFSLRVVCETISGDGQNGVCVCVCILEEYSTQCRGADIDQVCVFDSEEDGVGGFPGVAKQDPRLFRYFLLSHTVQESCENTVEHFSETKLVFRLESSALHLHHKKAIIKKQCDRNLDWLFSWFVWEQQITPDMFRSSDWPDQFYLILLTDHLLTRWASRVCHISAD